MSNLVNHAKRELDVVGMTEDSGEMNVAMRDHLIGMVEKFAEEGHSGFSAAYAANALNKLLRFEPLCPLTGEDSEWNEVSDDMYQNNRCSHVFWENGVAYDMDGRIFVDKKDGSTYTNMDSRVNIEFPYTPKREYVER